MTLERRRGFKRNSANIQRLLVSDLSDDIAKKGARGIVLAAGALASSEGLVDTGAYASSFKASRSNTDRVVTEYGPHATWTVSNDDPAAAPIEFGNRRRPAHRILLRAAMRVHSPRKGRAAKRVGRGRRSS